MRYSDYRGRCAALLPMYFFFATVVAGLYVATARPGALSNQDFSMIVAVAVLSFLGLMDNIKRRR